ncbi:MAG: CBS domain-containing protein [Acidimicrobiia bacterium]|nr:CBS domain-containing protein [Acidimicrobiia bacterium]
MTRYTCAVMFPASTPRRITLLSALAAVLGLLSGAAAWVLVSLISLITNFSLFGQIGWELPSMSTLEVGPRIVIAAVIGGLLVGLIAKWSPLIKGHGIPEAMESVLRNQSRVAPRTAIAKPLSAAIAIGTGGPFGAEGPIIVTGGSLGSLIGQVIDVSPSERKILLACGAAGGMAATFGAPIAAIVLAIELLLFEFSTRAFIPIAISASVAGGVHSAIFGAGPLFTVPDHVFAGLSDLPYFIPLGILAGLAAVVIAKGLFLVEAGFRRLPVSETWHPAIGALGFAIIGLGVPNVLGVGYDVIDEVLSGQLAVGTLAVLAVAKLVAWWLALGSGTSGGTLAPILLIAGAFGAVVGHATLAVFPGTELGAGAFSLVAMAAIFGAATRATLTSIVFVFELTRDYEAILPLILAAVLADLVATWFLPQTLMTEKLARRGVRVPSDLQADAMASGIVGELMTRHVTTVTPDATVGVVLDLVQSSGHSAFPVIEDDDVMVGIVTRSDLLDPTRGDRDTPIMEIARTDVVTVTKRDSLRDAIDKMIMEGVEHIPVVEGDRLVGMCTRTDILGSQSRQLREDRRQKGWRPPRRGRTRHPSGGGDAST